MKFLKDRRVWIDWLYTASKRFGLCVLDYTVTSNHVHLIVRDRGRGEIARSMQLIAGRTGQQFNERKQRRGAFWEDRYHATAIESGEHLARCLTYVDLNMVRAGVTAHPAQWHTCGYHEIQRPPRRLAIIDRQALAESVHVSLVDLAARHAEWIADALACRSTARVRQWSTSIAVGSRGFVEAVEGDLHSRANGRELQPFDAVAGAFVLREACTRYGYALGGKKERGDRKWATP